MFIKKRNMKNRIPVNKVRSSADYVISQLSGFWKNFRTPQLHRVYQELSWVFVEGGTIVDIGGSSGFHTSVMAQLGMKAICVDNFKTRKRGNMDDRFYEHDLEAEKVASKLGVEFIHTDVLDWEPPFEQDSIEVVMSFDNIEHLHHSPRNLYKKLIQCLRPEGLFLLGGPNAANLFKRAMVPLGRNIYSRLEDWYMHEHFIGHVREPVVSDFLFIARDLDLKVINIAGRNWLGLGKLPGPMQAPAGIFSKILELFPALCSDIYLLATK